MSLSSSISDSPSGKYTCLVTPLTVLCSIGVVYSECEVLFAGMRNSSTFPFAFGEDHPDGRDYFIYSDNYASAPLVRNLLTGEVNRLEWDGWIWVSWEVSPCRTMIAVLGCYWSGPEDIRVYDFSSPMTSDFRLLHDDDCIDGFRWEKTQTRAGLKSSLVYWRAKEVCSVSGKTADEMTDEEFDSVESWQEVRAEVHWN